MLRDTLRAALAAFVLWPMLPPGPVAAPAPPPPPVLMMPPPPVLMMPPAPSPAGPVARVLGAADRLAARWLP
jgi:hypothetical protein